MAPTPAPEPEHLEWKSLPQAEIERLIDAEADRNGIEKPQGYKVSFHYNADVESHHFGKTHPMKPWRLMLSKQLIVGYGLQYAMECYQSLPATRQELARFHTDRYLDFLGIVNPLNMEDWKAERDRFGFGDDCPVFDGMWDYVSLYGGASLQAARTLMSHEADIAINWSGGLHHAKKSAASGFCYVNDIVLAIQEMLRHHARVLYVDIDVHHGDGVEQAFWSTDRVCTLSYHKYDPEVFFPGTGGADETGPPHSRDEGAHHALNVPLDDGIDDEQYGDLFRRITGAVIDAFDPGAIVLQCGADSLGGDRLGRFNLNIKAHGACVAFVKSRCHDRPLLILGGGGYTPRNVARTWCHETALAVGAELRGTLPAHIPYRQAFMGEDNGAGLLYPELHNIEGKRHQNRHSPAGLARLVENVLTQLRYVRGAPSVQMQELPRDYSRARAEAEERFQEELMEMDGVAEGRRRRKEKNVGGRGEFR
ncbi:hypothetical protein BDY21DRAFT_290979 [Lineolata rhizophorae]|uniref:Histone deacetylase n=1 Tax=Lineolata rhizophorae TaxID=578093 RepID=A0A6A6NSZ9_9PEZI|nr:hypothetical protein BDY21DRAFT_290979 [Lineolata rhizophorae]